MKKICLLAILTFALGACKKDEGGGSNKSVTDLLTSGIWKFTSISANPSTLQYVSGSCANDDLLAFKTGGVAIFDDGTVSCGGDQTRDVPWLLGLDEKSITIEGGDTWTCGFNSFSDVVWKIVSLSENTLVVQYTEGCGGLGGGPWEITITFKH